jgi:hypothetical protein
MTSALETSRTREIKPASPARMHVEMLAKKHPRFHLRHPSGLYLNLDGTKLTPKKSEAYIGFAGQVRTISASLTLAGECKAVPA